MYVVGGGEGEDVLVATEGGYAKRTPADQYPLRNRGGLGVITAQITEGRGGLVGALMVRPDDEVFAITSNGGVIRTRASEVRQTGRVTMGVRLMNLASGVTVVALARNAESVADSVVADDGAAETDGDVDNVADGEVDGELDAEVTVSDDIAESDDSADGDNEAGDTDV